MSIHMLCSNYTEIEQKKIPGRNVFSHIPEESDEAEATEPQKHERVRKGITSNNNTKETSKNGEYITIIKKSTKQNKC